MTKPVIAQRLLGFMLLLSAAAYAEKPADPSDGQLYRGDGKVQAWSASAGPRMYGAGMMPSTSSWAALSYLTEASG